MKLALTTFIYFFLALRIVNAETISAPHVKVDIVSEFSQISLTNRTLTIGVRFELEKDWHIYWINPGDSGSPPEFNWSKSDLYSIGEPLWPPPERLSLGPLTNFGYQGTVIFPFSVKLNDIDLPITTNSVKFELDANWLICKEDCIPGKGTTTLDLPLKSGSLESEFAHELQDIIKRSPLKDKSEILSGRVLDNNLIIKLKSNFNYSNPLFYPFNENIISNSGEQLNKSNLNELTVPLANEAPNKISGIITWFDNANKKTVGINVTIDTKDLNSEVIPEITPQLSIWLLIFYAWLGGIILNAMPCVFPVIGLKIMQFLGAANGSRSKALLHSLVFAAGIEFTMTVLVATLLFLRSSGAVIGWGFHLQSPTFVILLIFLFVGMALNFFGILELKGSILQQTAGKLDKGDGYKGSFLSGVLATIIATPCTAPFMATAVGVALSGSITTIIAIFSSLGLGIATPYIVLSLFPQWQRLLPKPGEWMVTLKQLFGFPLLGTVIWLLWVLGHQVNRDAPIVILFGLLIIGLALFISRKTYTTLSKILIFLICFSVVGSCIWWSKNFEKSDQLTEISDNVWIPYSDEKLHLALKKGRSVFIDFTADWCITCQVNKKRVLETEQVTAEFNRHNVLLLKADWTLSDAKITKALSTYNRQSVPLNVLYRSGENDNPIIFPSLLTKDKVLLELAKIKS
jgi:thiol:disulfide interchange protein